MQIRDEDVGYLARARELALLGWGQVLPNPMVGCVLVRDGVVVAEGHHPFFGGPHAEVVALGRAEGRAAGATAYVSLEPCSHQGKTPPCTAALLAAGVRRVVYGAADGGSRSGGGARELAEAGVEVVGPLLTLSQALVDNAPFFVARDGPVPFLALKLALSLDGGIARSEGQRTPLTGSAVEAEVHRLRAHSQAILVGANTLRVDDPELTARGDVQPRVAPLRVVVTASGGLPLESRLLRDPDPPGTLVLAGPTVPEAEVRQLEARGVCVERMPEDSRGGTDLRHALRTLRARGIHSVLCEGGGRLAGALLSGKLVHRLHLYWAPLFLGEERVPGFPGLAGGARGDWAPIRPPTLRGGDVEMVLDRTDLHVAEGAEVG